MSFRFIDLNSVYSRYGFSVYFHTRAAQLARNMSHLLFDVYGLINNLHKSICCTECGFSNRWLLFRTMRHSLVTSYQLWYVVEFQKFTVSPPFTWVSSLEIIFHLDSRMVYRVLNTRFFRTINRSGSCSKTKRFLLYTVEICRSIVCTRIPYV